MKIKNKIEIKTLSDGDINIYKGWIEALDYVIVFGSRIFIEEITDMLRDLGYDVGQTISDFRESHLYTNAPMSDVVRVKENILATEYEKARENETF